MNRILSVASVLAAFVAMLLAGCDSPEYPMIPIVEAEVDTLGTYRVVSCYSGPGATVVQVTPAEYIGYGTMMVAFRDGLHSCNAFLNSPDFVEVVRLNGIYFASQVPAK